MKRWQTFPLKPHALLLAAWLLGALSAAAQSVYSEAYTFSTFAGIEARGSADGTGTFAQFDSPFGVAVAMSGNVYVADSDNNTIRKITQAGVVTTLAGAAGDSGTNDGTGSAARFYYPTGVAVDSNETVYVADAYNNTIREITPSGIVTTLAGAAGYYGTNDGVGIDALFDYPKGVAVDGSGNVYVADAENNAIRKITPAGVVTTLAGSPQFDAEGNPIGGSADGTGSAAQFNFPQGVAVDSDTNVYVADSNNNTIRKITPEGAVTTLAGLAGDYGTNDGTRSEARFNYPSGVTVGSAGNVFVADTDNDTIRKITPKGVVTTLAGLPGYPGNMNGTGTNAQFSGPASVAVGSAGNVYVADTDNSTMREITPVGLVTTLAGVAVSAGYTDGAGTEARFDLPWGIAVDASGNVFVADTVNCAIRKITAAGLVTTLAGAGYVGSSDGVGSEALFFLPKGLTVDGAENVYVADSYNDTIRKITPEGVVTTLAGSVGIFGHADGVGTNALFDVPFGMAVDSQTNIYVADSENNTIRELTLLSGATNWTVTTIAGLAGQHGSADGPGASARFYSPSGLAIDSGGSLYVADALNYTIRKITPQPGTTNWLVSTIAGSPGVVGSVDGIGTNALFGDGGYAYDLYGPYGVAVDKATNVYVADSENSTIRKIMPVGSNWIVSTIGGAVGEYSFDNGAGSAALFDFPDGLAVDNTGTLYVADTDNNAIRLGVFTPYAPAQAVSVPRPDNSAVLTVTLLPPEANGQWRFPWELTWRDSGGAATNLVPGEYPIEFKTVAGYLILPLIGFANGATVTNLVAVTSGETTFVTNRYYPTLTKVDTNNGGSLTVNIGPSPPNGAGWRFQGEPSAFYPPGYTTNLLRGTYIIEFAPVGGFVTPSTLSVHVNAGVSTMLTITYLLASSPPAGVLLPTPVRTAALDNLTDHPFGFNGQLETDVGFGSGVAVETNVVLTAAHMIFNDQTLSYVSAAYWFFHEDVPLFEAEPLQARGWYVLSGYASQRTNDVLGGLGPDQSSPQSRNLDAAALYFEAPVADGAYGGFLPSDATPNTWLTSAAEKMLVGYPVDGSQFGFTNIVNGQMYQIGPQPYTLSLSPEALADQQVYVAPWFLSYPGNSGGPLYVEFDGYYYPAGIYLGTLFNGVEPYASAVRAIDSNVVTLISEAAALGDSGTNNSGGGVITIIPSGVSSSHPAYLIMSLGPPAAVAAGAAWEFASQPSADYLSASQSVQELSSSANVSLQFLPIAGWNLPPNQTLTLEAGVNTFAAAYTVAITWPTPAPISSGTALGPQQLDAAVTITSGTYSYNPPAGTVLSAGAQTLSVTFTPADASNYGGPSTTNVTLVVLSSSTPVIQAVRQSGSAFTLTWNAAIHQTYQIQSATTLAQAKWVNSGSPITATNSTMSASLPVGLKSQEYYRLMVLP